MGTPFKPCVRISRTRLGGGLSSSHTRPFSKRGLRGVWTVSLRRFRPTALEVRIRTRCRRSPVTYARLSWPAESLGATRGNFASRHPDWCVRNCAGPRHLLHHAPGRAAAAHSRGQRHRVLLSPHGTVLPHRQRGTSSAPAPLRLLQL